MLIDNINNEFNPFRNLLILSTLINHYFLNPVLPEQVM